MKKDLITGLESERLAIGRLGIFEETLDGWNGKEVSFTKKSKKVLSMDQNDLIGRTKVLSELLSQDKSKHSLFWLFPNHSIDQISEKFHQLSNKTRPQILN